MEKEILKLKKKGYEVGIQTSDGRFVIDGEVTKLQGKELEQYNMDRGEYMYKQLERLFATEVYKKSLSRTN